MNEAHNFTSKHVEPDLRTTCATSVEAGLETYGILSTFINDINGAHTHQLIVLFSLVFSQSIYDPN
jgi:hypothetical protein